MNNKGFTLIEVLVALAISAVLSGAVYFMYQSQVQTQLTQLAISEMHQQARAAMMLMEGDIRMAGSDPLGTADAGFVTIAADEIHFTRDITGGLGPNGNGDNLDNDKDGQIDEIDEWYNGVIDNRDSGSFYFPQEDVRYALNPNGRLVRQTGSISFIPSGTPPGEDLVATNVDALDFEYLNELGAVTADPDDVRAVLVTLIVSSDNPVLMRNQTDTTNYVNSRGKPIFTAPGDLRRRIILTSEIRVRNTGLDV